jgi:hypothetical protein
VGTCDSEQTPFPIPALVVASELGLGVSPQMSRQAPVVTEQILAVVNAKAIGPDPVLPSALGLETRANRLLGSGTAHDSIR